MFEDCSVSKKLGNVYARGDTARLTDLNRPFYGMPCKTSICKIQDFNYVRPKRNNKGTGKREMVERPCLKTMESWL